MILKRIDLNSENQYEVMGHLEEAIINSISALARNPEVDSTSIWEMKKHIAQITCHFWTVLFLATLPKTDETIKAVNETSGFFDGAIKVFKENVEVMKLQKQSGVEKSKQESAH